ncbi:MAG: porin [Flavobacteriaceae bacterium]|nr:porin [Flavobacteriaceae bacterium]|tara:strand:+ start:3603 stop:4229 length:627 start_codon:yes stop_codon:yes gene_type:complete
MKNYIIEFLGTFFLVLIIGLTENPIAIGLGLAVLVYMGAHISGAHYNPAVTLAMYINNKIDIKESGKYIVSQLAGSVIAVFLISKLGQNSFSVVSKTTDIQSFFVAEILFTFLLVFVILNVALSESLKGNQFYGLAIGLTVTAGAFSVGDISGAVFNPAVSFGPSLMSFIDPLVVGNSASSSDFFIYFLIAGIIGSVLASYLYKKVFK